MFKFKVGDRVVRARHSANISNCPIGYQTVVTGLLGDDKPYGIWYTAPDGHRQNSSCPQDWDLVDPIESPIRTVTRRELVPGEYGSILVDRLANDGSLVVLGFKTTGNIFPDCRSLFSADDLRSACMVLSQLAEFLDEDKGDE